MPVKWVHLLLANVWDFGDYQSSMMIMLLEMMLLHCQATNLGRQLYGRVISSF